MRTDAIHKQGFTLIELLVVVAMIGILSAIAINNYHLALEKTDAAGAQHNLRILSTALQSYRIDHNAYPLADGLADSVPRPDQTAWGCGPAANGYWSGVPLALVDQGYCQEPNLYDPALKRKYNESIEAYSTCEPSTFSGHQVPRWRFMRFAYNYAALDAGAAGGGEQNVEESKDGGVWLVRSLHIDVGDFDLERAVPFPHRVVPEDEPNSVWNGEFELTLGGDIHLRAVQRLR
ncbi:MAG: prepilin-type N-terminal cleavage/methylation domain-containing protein [Candidatus Hinthialibacter antarcticus]|nr:prepilin-type N-terminal cleavage/methylation domain-containing protein [Candidatus Hinthialibacter antarcticus]